MRTYSNIYYTMTLHQKCFISSLPKTSSILVYFFTYKCTAGFVCSLGSIMYKLWTSSGFFYRICTHDLRTWSSFAKSFIIYLVYTRSSGPEGVNLSKFLLSIELGIRYTNGLSKATFNLMKSQIVQGIYFFLLKVPPKIPKRDKVQIM